MNPDWYCDYGTGSRTIRYRSGSATTRLFFGGGGGLFPFILAQKSNQNGGEKNTRYRLFFHYSFCINIVQDSLQMN